jgi:hypothetical protein
MLPNLLALGSASEIGKGGAAWDGIVGYPGKGAMLLTESEISQDREEVLDIGDFSNYREHRELLQKCATLGQEPGMIVSRPPRSKG